VPEAATSSFHTYGFTVRLELTVAPLYVAEIGTMVVVVTADVVIVNAGELVDPAATVTVDGTDAPGPADRFTTAPAGGAGAFKMTLLKVVELPPTTDVGERATEYNPTGLTVRLAVLVTPL
jgi:hypothetical protein